METSEFLKMLPPSAEVYIGSSIWPITISVNCTSFEIKDRQLPQRFLGTKMNGAEFKAVLQCPA